MSLSFSKLDGCADVLVVAAKTPVLEGVDISSCTSSYVKLKMQVAIYGLQALTRLPSQLPPDPPSLAEWWLHTPHSPLLPPTQIYEKVFKCQLSDVIRNSSHIREA